MINQEFENEKLLIVATAKLFSDQSTYTLGLMKHQPKYYFNLAIKSIDRFVEEMESNMDDEDKARLLAITNGFNDGLVEMRAELNKVNVVQNAN